MARKKAAAKSTQSTVQVFISYSNRDRDLLDQLLKHLRPLADQGLLGLSYDQTLEAGTDWSTELPRLLSEAPIVLFLVSPESLSSAFISRELELALSQQETKRIIPVLLRPCDWFASPLAKYMALPTGAKPVTTWENRDEAFLDIARGVRQVIESVQQTSARGELPAKHKGQINRIAITADGRLVVSAGADGAAIVWDANTLQPTGELVGHSAPLTSVQVSADGKLAATSSQDKTIKVWDLASRREIRSLQGHTAAVTAVSFTEDGRRLISGSQDSTLRLWEVETGKCLRTIKTDDPIVRVIVIPGRGLAVSTQGRELSVWDLDSAAKVRSLSLPKGDFGLSATSHATRVITCDLDGFSVRDIDNGTVILRSARALFNAVVALPDGRRAVAAHRDGLQLWDLTNGTAIREAKLGNEIPIDACRYA